MRRKRRIMFTAEGAYYLFVLAFVFTGAVLREINLMLVLAGMMLGPLFYNIRTTRRMTQHVAVRRRLPDSATVGEPVAVELVVSSKTKSLGLRLIDCIGRMPGYDPAGRAKATATLADCSAVQSTTVRYRLLFPRRGEHHFGPLQIKCSYPFGLIRRTIEHKLPGTLLVFPRLGVLTTAWDALFQQAAHGAQRQRRQSYAAGDFYGLRDYRSGDSRRHIHWRTSARRGNLMVRQFERSVHQDVAVYIDLWQPSQPTQHDQEQVERAVSFAATLVHVLCRRGGCQIWLALAGAREPPLAGVASTSLLHEALARLARAATTSHGFDQERCAVAFSQAPRRATRVFVTARPETSYAMQPSHGAADWGETWSDGRLVSISTRASKFDELFQFVAPPADAPIRLAANGPKP
jgi:uncharacterized protein (DUF58 family)